MLHSRNSNSNHRFSIRGYKTFRRDRESEPKGLLILVKTKNSNKQRNKTKNNHPAVEIYRSEDADTEVLGIKLLLDGHPLSIYNLYSPKTLSFHNIKPDGKRWIIVGDFNSHSPSWGYPYLGSKGEEVEDWIIINQIVLINYPDYPHTYHSRAWRTTSCLDLAIATDDVTKITRHHVDQQLGGSDHKPVILHIKQDSQPTNIKQCPSWNYKKANWTDFKQKQISTAKFWTWVNTT